MEIKKRIALIILENKLNDKADYSRKIGVSVFDNKRRNEKVA